MTGLLAQAADLTSVEGWFVALVDRSLASPAVAVLAAIAAVGVGAVHALTPGHGKAIAAAYLVAGRGRARDAVVLGAGVAVMHLVSVVALAAILGAFLRVGSQPGVPPDVLPQLRLASGVAVLALGVFLVARLVRGRHRHDHDHAPQDAAAVTRPGLVVLGAAGGLLPSPAAFLVLVTTSFSGRLWLGLLLVALFSVGLAATLTLIGLAVVRGRQTLADRVGADTQQRLARVAAVVGAIVVLAGGVLLTGAAVAAL